MIYETETLKVAQLYMVGGGFGRPADRERLWMRARPKIGEVIFVHDIKAGTGRFVVVLGIQEAAFSEQTPAWHVTRYEDRITGREVKTANWEESSDDK